MGRNDRLLQEIDSKTGEIVRAEILRWDEDFFIRRGADGLKKFGYFYDKWSIKSFSIKRYVLFFRKHPELYFYTRVMSEYLWANTGLLRRINEPYRWKHLGDDLNFDRTTLYRIREKLLVYGVVGEVKIFGTKYICINPYIFGFGDRCLKEVAEYFKFKGAQIRGLYERELNKER